MSRITDNVEVTHHGAIASVANAALQIRLAADPHGQTSASPQCAGPGLTLRGPPSAPSAGYGCVHCTGQGCGLQTDGPSHELIVLSHLPRANLTPAMPGRALARRAASQAPCFAHCSAAVFGGRGTEYQGPAAGHRPLPRAGGRGDPGPPCRQETPRVLCLPEVGGSAHAARSESRFLNTGGEGGPARLSSRAPGFSL